MLALVESNCQIRMWLRASVARSSRGWRKNGSVLTEAGEHTLLSATPHVKSNLLFLSPASHPITFTYMSSDGLNFLVRQMMLQQTSPFTRWIRDSFSGDCQAGVLGPGSWCWLPVFSPAGHKGVWAPSTFDATQLSNFCPLDGSVMSEFGLNLHFYHC